MKRYVNKQNFRYWADANPQQLHEKPLHSEKVTVWCAMSSNGIIGPYFFEDAAGHSVTVTSARYLQMLETFLIPQLQQLPVNVNTHFQQDGATSHTARISMNFLRNLFPNHLISRNGDVQWPPRSCALRISVPDSDNVLKMVVAIFLELYSKHETFFFFFFFANFHLCS